MEIELNRFTPAEQATFRLRALYEQAGYRKYRASRFEEYALYQEYQRFLPDAQVITFTDLDGKLRAIKPDVTLSIAKTAQPAAGECKRFYYNEEVCRPSRESHTFQTIHQMGLESMGAVDADEQAAVVRLALQSLAALDVPTVLEVSHMGYLTGLLDALNVPAETVFVLGMGGQTLSRILEEGRERLHGAALVLGAQTDLPLLRQTLCRIGYRIRQEQPVKENRRYYLLMQCTPALDGERVYDERELLLGPVLLRERPPLWRDLLERRERLLHGAISSMEQAKTPVDGSQLALYRRELSYVRRELEKFY